MKMPISVDVAPEASIYFRDDLRMFFSCFLNEGWGPPVWVAAIIAMGRMPDGA